MEAFARRQFSRVKYPHQAALFSPAAAALGAQPRAQQPFLVVAGLNRWAWVDGVFGPESRAPGEGEVPYAWVEVYRFSEDRGSNVFRQEQVRREMEGRVRAGHGHDPLLAPLLLQAARWADAHPEEHQAGAHPTASQLAHVDIGATLDIVRSYVFPFT